MLSRKCHRRRLSFHDKLCDLRANVAHATEKRPVNGRVRRRRRPARRSRRSGNDAKGLPEVPVAAHGGDYRTRHRPSRALRRWARRRDHRCDVHHRRQTFDLVGSSSEPLGDVVQAKPAEARRIPVERRVQLHATQLSTRGSGHCLRHSGTESLATPKSAQGALALRAGSWTELRDDVLWGRERKLTEHTAILPKTRNAPSEALLGGQLRRSSARCRRPPTTPRRSRRRRARSTGTRRRPRSPRAARSGPGGSSRAAGPAPRRA